MQPNVTDFLCMLARSSDGVGICYAHPVLRMRSCFHTIGTTGGRMGMALCTSSPVATGGAQATIGRLAR